MRRVLKVIKTTRVLKVRDILTDVLAGVSDEKILEKYDISFSQLYKVYGKLFHAGFLEKDDLFRRIQLRGGRDSSHIPFAELEDSGYVYECRLCGYASMQHFSTCPRCNEVNLRRLTRTGLAAKLMAAQTGA